MTFVSGADQGDGLFLSVLTLGVHFDIDDHTILVDCFEQLAGSVAPRKPQIEALIEVCIYIYLDMILSGSYTSTCVFPSTCDI